MTRTVHTLIVLAVISCSVSAGGINGTWDFVYETPEGNLRSTADLKLEGDELTMEQKGMGSVKGTYQDGEFQIRVDSYYSPEAGYSAPLELEGRFDGEKITGKWEFDVYAGNFSATRSGS
jgi:hypothetical protein